MPNKPAAMKDLRKSKKRAAKNALAKTHIKSLSRKFKDAVAAGKKDDAKKLVRDLQQMAAKAGQEHVYHANKSSRVISQAMRAVSKM